MHILRREAREFADLERREWADADVARSYANAFAKASDMVVPHLVAAVDTGPGRTVLDLCCGQGTLSAMLAASCAPRYHDLEPLEQAQPLVGGRAQQHAAPVGHDRVGRRSAGPHRDGASGPDLAVASVPTATA